MAFICNEIYGEYRDHTGIFNNCVTNLNHAVLLIGCNSSGVWKIKNSWGVNWGQSGYM
jgi:C1A family cysteine protease